MKKTFIIILTLILMAANVPVFAAPDDPVPRSGVEIFVAANGSDSGDGSLASPFLTLEKARQAVRSQIAAGTTGAITVNIRGGEYKLDSTLSFRESDSGSPGVPITWQAYHGEPVLITTGIQIESSLAKPVTDTAILARVTDAEAKSKLMYLDLSSYISTWPDFLTSGSFDAQANQPEIYINGHPLMDSRWPNNVQNQAYINMSNIKITGGGSETSQFTFNYDDPNGRSQRWSAQSLNDLYIYGFVANDWTDRMFKINSLNASSNSASAVGRSISEGFDNAHFYFMNLLEEIDVPGESYVDRANRIVYFYPPCDMTNADIRFAASEAKVFDFYRSSNIVIRGLDFSYIRENAILFNGSNNVVIEDCTISHCSGAGIIMYNMGTNCIVRNCSIFDTNNGLRFFTSSASRASLVSRENIIENNRFHHNSRRSKWSSMSIYVMNDVGTQIRNNYFSDAPGVAVYLSGANDALVESNEFSKVCLEASDVGAIYIGGNITATGIEIKNNYFHDIGNTYGGAGQQSIFSDDGGAAPYIYGNVFYRASDRDKENRAPIKTHGAQFGVVKNNIIISSPSGAYFQDWSYNSGAATAHQDRWLLRCYSLDDGYTSGGWSVLTDEVDFFSATWREHYQNTQWAPLWNYLSPEGRAQAQALAGDTTALRQYAYNNAPDHTNLFTGNVCVDISSGKLFYYNGTDGQNYSATSSQMGTLFQNPSAGNFTLTAPGLQTVQQTIPGFQNISMAGIGIKPYNSYGEMKLPGDDTSWPGSGTDNGSGSGNGSGTGSGNGTETGNSSGSGGGGSGGGGGGGGNSAGNRLNQSSADYDQNNPKDITVNLILVSGSTLNQITNGDLVLRAGTDYTKNGNEITIKKEYLATLSAGIHNLVFDLSSGIDPRLTITINQSAAEGDGSEDGWINPFTDVRTGDWFYADVAYVVQQELFNGTSATSFSPNLPMTRGMLVTVLGRMAGIDPDDYRGASFSDVDENQYYAPYVKWAADMGIVTGIGDNRFAPDANISRQDLAVILNNYADKMGIIMMLTLQNVVFTDSDDIAAYATDAVSKLVAAGVISGRDDGSFDPLGNATRAEVAAMLHRFGEVSN